VKYAIIIPDGAPDVPQPALAGRTPLQAARLPALDSLAASARLGTTCTVDEKAFPSEAAAHLAVLGYAPERHPAGEGTLMAQARGIDFGPRDIVFCCDLVTVIDGCLHDSTAGAISPAEVTPLIETLNTEFGAEGFQFHDCGGYRNVCVWKEAGPLPELRTTPPDRILKQPTKRHMPPGAMSRTLYDVMLRAEAILGDHDVNAVRNDLGENAANAIWLWGHAPLRNLTPFWERFGTMGGLTAGSDVVRGIGIAIGWDTIGANADGDASATDLSARGAAAVAALGVFDLVCVHVDAPFRLSAAADIAGKVRALEAIDSQIVAPLLTRLQAEPEWRMLVIPARAAPAAWSADAPGGTLFALTGSGIESNRGESFDEDNAAAGEMHLDRAHDLMEYFLHR
jgi:2,3-bisphosphoglycerate-independent phosphoglycerate mutase